MSLITVPASRTYNPAHFFFVEWLCQQVECSQIQEFCPFPFVSQP